MGILERNQKGNHNDEPGAPLLRGEAERSRILQPAEEEAQGDLYKKPKDGCAEDTARLLSVVLSATIRWHGYKLSHTGAPSDHQEQFCALPVMKYWHRLH